jgi:hypothetical protein
MFKILIIICSFILLSCSSEDDMKNINKKEISPQEQEDIRLKGKANLEKKLLEYQEKMKQQDEISLKKSQEEARLKAEQPLKADGLKYEQECLKRGSEETTCKAMGMLYQNGYR